MKNSVKNMCLASMFLALGLVLPFVTGQIPVIGRMLLPMHLPVFLCGLICGWKYGLLTGLLLPLLRSLLFGMPVLYPVAIAMACELAVYGFVSGYLYEKSPWQCIKALYRSLLSAMLAGRLVWGIVQYLLLAAAGSHFTLQAFLAGAFADALPGIVLQLILIPAIMLVLHRTGLVPFKKTEIKQI